MLTILRKATKGDLPEVSMRQRVREKFIAFISSTFQVAPQIRSVIELEGDLLELNDAIQQYHLFVCLFACDLCRLLVPTVKKHPLRLADSRGIYILRLLEACLLFVDGLLHTGELSGRHRVFAMG